MKLGEVIRALRSSHGMNQLTFARTIGVSAATASLWESGDRLPTIAHRVKLAKMFDQPIERFVPEMAATTMR